MEDAEYHIRSPAVRPRVGEDGSDYPSNIAEATGEVLPRPNGRKTKSAMLQ
jgi:hypothetical protein